MSTTVENHPPAGSGVHHSVTPPQMPLVAARTAAASSRTNRKLLIVGVLVVLVGGVIGLGAGRLLTQHTQVLAVAREVQVGAAITAADLTIANVTTDPHLSPIPASQRSSVIGAIAQVALTRGELLTRAQIGTGSGFTRGQMLVALALKQGQFPARGLVPGQSVLVISTPGANPTTTTDATVPAPINAVVTEVGEQDVATQITVIDVRVDQDHGVTLTRLASTGNLALILLPAGR